MNGSNNDPTMPDGFVDIMTSDVPEPEPLTEEEMLRAMDIIRRDDLVGSILKKVNWNVLFINGLYTEDLRKVGADVHIVLEEPVWFEGTYPVTFKTFTHTARMWISSIHVSVDLTTDKIIGVEPGLSNKPGKVPLDKDEEKAKEIAYAYALKELGIDDIRINMLGRLQSPEYSKGLVAFLVMQGEEDRMIVTVDLDKMEVDGERTGKIVR
ncbi:MAG: hypothetical protein RMI32_00100 [Candidatus Nitrosocaldus sp.]|nr:hypothetical protein [Candidatus Nitrosocaldus sp.]